MAPTQNFSKLGGPVRVTPGSGPLVALVASMSMEVKVVPTTPTTEKTLHGTQTCPVKRGWLCWPA